MDVPPLEPIRLFVIVSRQSIAATLVFHEQTQHTKADFHQTKDAIQEGLISILHV